MNENPLFNFLGVIVSVIVGMGVMHLVHFIGSSLVRFRAVNLDYIGFTWLLILFLLQVESWYDFKNYSSVNWGFTAFLMYLIEPVVLYLLVYILFPTRGNVGEHIFIEYYTEVYQVFFTLLMIFLSMTLINSLFLRDSDIFAIDNVIRLLSLLVFTGAFVDPSLRLGKLYHIILSSFSVLLLFAYIGFYHVANDLGK